MLCLVASAASAEPRARLLRNAEQQRDAQQWTQALAAYRQGRLDYPQDAAFAQGEIYVLADAGQTDQAVALAEQQLALRPDDADALLVMAYAQLRRHGVFAALEYVDRAVAVAGDRPYVLRDYVAALQRVHLSSSALQIAEQRPGLLSAEQMLALQVDALAEQVRFADLPTRAEAERFALADRALAGYDRLRPQLAQAGAEGLAQRARVDRLLALQARFRMAEVAGEYEALQAEGRELPAYALEAVASAYLYLRQPERSAELYQGLIASDYQRQDEEMRQSQDVGLLYAYADQGRVGQSQQQSQTLPAQYAPWRYVEGEAVPTPNEVYLQARHTATMMDFYANATPQAQRQLEQMVSLAPNNSNLRTDLAWLYRSRGWPRLAEETLKIAESYDPRSLGVEVGQGLAALSLQEWRQTELLSADMQSRYPEDRRVQRLGRLWQVHNLAELQVSGYRGLSDQSPVSGGHDFGLETRLYSQPLAYNWRLLAGAGHRSASFEDGQGRHNYSRLGLEWRSRDWTVIGEISDNHYGHGSQLGAAISAEYALDDHWQLSALAQRHSRDTPLQALRNRITSDRLDIGLQWRDSERRAWKISLAPSRFSDGNRRWEVLLNGQERLLTRPNWYLDLGLDAFASGNRRSDRPYYSPRQEWGITPTLTWNHTLYQRYETAWTQQASVGLGGLRQQGYGSAGIGVIAYGQRYSRNDTFEAGATLSATTRPYDGTREREWRLVFDMTFRF